MKLKKLTFLWVLLCFGAFLNAQENVNKGYKTNLEIIKKYKDSLFDFHNYDPKYHPRKKQIVTLKNTVLTFEIVAGYHHFIHKVDLKNLERVKNYKEDGLLLTFGWKKVKKSKYFKHKDQKRIITDTKGMHLGIRIRDAALRKKLKKAFRDLILEKSK